MIVGMSKYSLWIYFQKNFQLKKSGKFSWTNSFFLEFQGSLLRFLLWYHAHFSEIGHESTKSLFILAHSYQKVAQLLIFYVYGLMKLI